jgi:hypothetical protein
MVGLLPRFRLEKWNITYGEIAGIDPELSSGTASEYGFRVFPQTYFVTISRKGQVKPVAALVSMLRLFVYDEPFIKQKSV